MSKTRKNCDAPREVFVLQIEVFATQYAGHLRHSGDQQVVSCADPWDAVGRPQQRHAGWQATDNQGYPRISASPWEHTRPRLS
jgi:hypothetical protein